MDPSCLVSRVGGIFYCHTLGPIWVPHLNDTTSLAEHVHPLVIICELMNHFSLICLLSTAKKNQEVVTLNKLFHLYSVYFCIHHFIYSRFNSVSYQNVTSWDYQDTYSPPTYHHTNNLQLFFLSQSWKSKQSYVCIAEGMLEHLVFA